MSEPKGNEPHKRKRELIRAPSFWIINREWTRIDANKSGYLNFKGTKFAKFDPL